MEDKPKILIVDDQPKNLHAMRRILEPLDAEIVEALSGQEALTHALHHEFFVILMDVQMPEMDGFEAASLLLLNKQTSKTPIIFVTAISKESKFVFQAYETGAVDYLFKPIEPEILMSKVSVFLELYRERKKSENLVVKLQHEMEERKRAEEERMRVEEQLRHTQKMETIATLAGGIAHDFNNILGSIIGYADLGLQVVDKDKPIFRYCTQIRDGARRAGNLVKQILSFSRDGDFDTEAIELKECLEKALELFKATMPATIELQVDLDPESGMVMADYGKMQQVVMNLCTNAVHAMMDTHGVLKVRMEAIELDHDFVRFHPQLHEGSYIRLVFTDTGCGMSEEVVARIFEPFFTTKEQMNGTGLGLSIVHGIIREHEGDIFVYSEEGKGTTFHIYLPKDESGFASDGEDEGPGLMPFGKERVLLVDDNEMVLDSGRGMLDALGYKVTATVSSSEALKIFQEDPNGFDVVIVDQSMPELTGTELITQLRRICPQQTVVLTSGLDSVLNDEEFGDYGINFRLTKPFTLREIGHAVREALK